MSVESGPPPPETRGGSGAEDISSSTCIYEFKTLLYCLVIYSKLPMTAIISKID